ncbi:hypothetical protein MTER_19810 [Mycolicibacter terrae]|uniref:Uncharacterized protein n=1 Tax=Mycolicibacter terrae TaxID=1788 RepID=A0AAD1MHS4_9MYCO|nr:hypothetical protein MTER_19810 [Mycolicibacter terrae]
MLKVGDLTQVHLLGELAARRGCHVLVVPQQSTRERPTSELGFSGALPEQDVEPGTAPVEAANLEDRGEDLVLGASMNHVFDCKSKT